MSRDISLLLATCKKKNRKSKIKKIKNNEKYLIKYDEEKLTANAFLSYTLSLCSL